MSKSLDRMFTSLPEKLSIDELTDVLGLSNRTVTYKWLRDGNVPAMKIGGSWLILRDDIKEHLELSYNVQPGVLGAPPSAADEQATPATPVSELVDEDESPVPEPAAEKSQEMSEATARSRRENQLIREWAKSNGFVVSPRGRISQVTMDAYDNAHL